MLQFNSFTTNFSPLPQHLRKKNLFKRCVDCAPVTTAGCPTSCSKDQVCVLTALECDKCPEYQCQSASAAGQVKLGSSPEKSAAPQIAGGVVGGVLFIAILLFLIWKFAIKKKRRHQSQMWESMDYPMEKPGEVGAIPRDARSRASTHTVASTASTVLTRASNIIQIAYIPGVTNRQGANGGSGSSTNGQHPPVPPVPIPTNEDQLLFHPGDLRSSAYTDISDFNGIGTRKSVTPSLARTSIASAFVRDNAVAVVTAKPALVSVRSTGSSPLSGTPPVPNIDMRRFGDSGSGASTPTTKGGVILKIPVSSDGIRFPSSSDGIIPQGMSPIPTGIPMKPRTLTITKKGKGSARSSDGSAVKSATSSTEKVNATPNLINHISSVALSSTAVETPHIRAKQIVSEEESSDDEGAVAGDRTRQTLLRKENVSPFTDEAAVESKVPTTPSTPGSPSSKGEGPFGDDHAVKE